MNFFIIALVVIAMEPITTFSHRFIMHNVGWAWHKDHHNRKGTYLEKNDYFPIVFSVLAIALFFIGIDNVFIREIATGLTIYGFIYFVVHEIVIHSRIFTIRSNNILFRYWRFGHNVHHQFHGAPFGFIVPVTPKSLAKKAKENPRDLNNRFPKIKL